MTFRVFRGFSGFRGFKLLSTEKVGSVLLGFRKSRKGIEKIRQGAYPTWFTKFA
jgi:hypothetical protein